MSLVIITGASRGFGKSIALEVAAKLPGEKWDFVLTSTKAADSELVAQEVTSKYGPRDIKTIAIDFADMQNLEKNIHALLALVRLSWIQISPNAHFS
jgi:short-subunit dehydrogenase